jgi:hypothetical protein
MSKDLCQADSTALGSDGIGSASSIDPSAEAYATVVARLIDWFSVSPDEQDIFALEDYQAIMRDAGLMSEDYELVEPASCRATPTQSPIEERSDTVTAEQREAGLTQKIEAQARKVVELCMRSDAFREIWNEGDVDLLEIISSALSTAYEEGKASISQHVDAAVRAEREACAEAAVQVPFAMTMFGDMYMGGAIAATEEIATAIRSRGQPNATTLEAMAELDSGDLPSFNSVDELMTELGRDDD